MSAGPINRAVWASGLPKFLQWGVAGKLAALADESGGKFFPGVISVNYLARQRYGRDNHRLCKQTIKYQLHAIQRCGFLEIRDNGRGRGHTRYYALHPEALATVQANDPMLRAPHRRAGAAPEGRILTRRYPASGAARKGDNKGDQAVQHDQSTPERPPNLAGPIGRPRRQRRWDAIRSPAENFAVFTKLADTLCDEAIAAGHADLPEDEFIENFKTRVANLMPGQMQNSGQVLAALDAAAYRRRLLGKPVPVHAGSKGQHKFILDRQHHTSGHARVDAH